MVRRLASQEARAALIAVFDHSFAADGSMVLL
jgi:hypothetical protein